MNQIKLKILFIDIVVLKDVASCFLDHLVTEKCDKQLAEYKKMEFSILYQLYLQLNELHHKANPPKTKTLKLAYHQALAMQNALLHYISIIKDFMLVNKAEILKNQLNQLIVNQEPISN